MAEGHLGDIFGKIGGGGGMAGLVINSIYILLGVGVLALCGFALYYFLYKKKHYNLNAEIKIPRSDGRLIIAEWGKASYNEKKGCIYIKRKKKKPVPMKIADPRKYIQGEKIITVIQLSPGNYVPVLPDSYEEVEDDKTGERAAVINIRADLSDDLSWRTMFEREAKAAYSITNLLREYAPYIGTGIIIFMMWAGFAILYSKVT